MVLKKGEIIDNLSVNDSTKNSYSLYIPKTFSMDEKWPLLMIFDTEGNEKKALSIFVLAAEKEGYVLAAPKLIDSISLTKNMVVAGQVIQKVTSLLPIHNDRIYAAGEDSGGQFASLVPILINGVNGAMSIGASLSNSELINVKKPFHFIGMVSKENFNYPFMLTDTKLLDRYKFPNQVLLFDGNGNWPGVAYLQKGMQLFTLDAMGRKWIPQDTSYIEKAYQEDLQKLNQLKSIGDLLWAEQYMTEMTSIYGALKNMDSLRSVQRDLRRNRDYKTLKRAENAAFLKESMLKEDYQYYMEEDVYTHNFNNLGWWNHQMDEIEKFISGSKPYEKQMGHRLKGFVNALAEDNINIIASEKVVDEDALAFLYMLKTILEPDNYGYYLKTISISAKNDDFGTSLFYLEELLKKGFKDKEKLYNLENTALFRITPEFNELVSKYLKDARYDIKVDEN
ncbi:alpha/beta hydrolase [Flagellimonas halotolerans]|uniref:Alpha/beta hydrolase n=2 Tax=Flagellimonas halotolerans TaxID=3112164 RepID=A0ABU6IPL7_9FLAO|nr:alpha/beta hydrolase [Muricauda sp. SYSU M84420]MEC3965109.1 alpha/beta hydrolase [Muricauda sp. SYSU M86414]MEC4265046.1 alpha/beta hydrolase [Muricauda sp. SYSU M84420]